MHRHARRVGWIDGRQAGDFTLPPGQLGLTDGNLATVLNRIFKLAAKCEQGRQQGPMANRGLPQSVISGRAHRSGFILAIEIEIHAVVMEKEGTYRAWA